MVCFSLSCSACRASAWGGAGRVLIWALGGAHPQACGFGQKQLPCGCRIPTSRVSCLCFHWLEASPSSQTRDLPNTCASQEQRTTLSVFLCQVSWQGLPTPFPTSYQIEAGHGAASRSWALCESATSFCHPAPVAQKPYLVNSIFKTKTQRPLILCQKLL